MEYQKTSLNIIKQAHILEQSDFDIIDNLKEELQDIFRYVQVFRTRTEMESCILNDLKFPTPDAKYWQSVREQNVMFNELVMLSYEYRKNQVEIKQLEIQLNNHSKMTVSDTLELELLQIEMEKKQFIALQQERTAKDRIREIREWHEIKQDLLPKLECSLTDVNSHQLISYTKRFINQFIASQGQGSPAERSNLLGQLDKGIKLCRQKGCLDKVYADIEPEVRKFIEKNGIGTINCNLLSE